MSVDVDQARSAGAIGSHGIEHAFPLSPLQQGMLFHSLALPGSGVDIEQLAFTIRGALDPEALRLAWGLIIERHEILRTSFHWQGLDEPLQHVHANGRLEFEQADWRRFAESKQRELLNEFLEHDRFRGFDLTQESLMRVALFQTAGDEFHFIWTFHHVLLDGRSCVSVLAQVYGFHESLRRGEPVHPDPPRPYREYLEWLKELDAGSDERFWRERLSGVNTPTPLPGVSSRPASGESRGHSEQQARLPAELTSSLKSLASDCGVTLYTLVQAAWAVLLSRHSGEPEIVFGATVAGRRLPGVGAESMIGLFINTLPVPIAVPIDTRLDVWLREIRARFNAMREHEHTALQLIQQWTGRGTGRPLFESILTFENYDFQSSIQSHWDDWVIRDFKLLEQTNYPLSVSGWSGDELLLKLEYDRQRFDDASISTVLGHLTTLLSGMVNRADRPVASLPMLTSKEQHQLTTGWNATIRRFTDACAHELFEAQAAKTPDAVAVVHQDTRLSYSELNKRANRLARCLQARGVGPETLVGLLTDRSPEMIVGLLAILKAGGAYVPLDPGYPEERLAAMITDADLSVLLTQRTRLAKLPETDAAVVCLDSESDTTALNSERNLNVRVAPTNLAYVIFTSGSTGNPKGVLVEHHSLSNYLQTAIERFALEPDDRVLQFASISFDTSAEEIVPCLARGAALVLRNDSMVSSTSAFLHQCRALDITVLDLPTAFWHELTAGIDDQAVSLPSSIRLVIIGGERALPERVADWHKLVGPRVRLLNTYGPTETTIVATIADLTARSNVLADAPVGRPIPNARTYILDRNGQPAPAGVTGELHVAGLGVARGYLNRPELTADRFLPDPFTSNANARMYRTGDLASYAPDGTIQLFGRVDQQVKINGFRIELEEIESAIRSVDYVRDAVVTAREDRPGEKHLVAYVVPQMTGDSFSQQARRGHLREALKKKLPSYMLPSTFIMLDGLPVSLNGKVDRPALPPPGFEQETDENYARPRDPLERQLVEIWEEVLGIRPIGIGDNFFSLGGHSLLSVRMIDRVERALGTRLAFGTLFKDATIERLAAALKDQEKVGTRSPIVKIREGRSTRPFFFLHGDFNGGGFYCASLARGLGPEHTFYAVQPHGLDGGAIPLTIEAMAESQIREIRTLQPRGPYLLGGYCNGGTIAFEMARQLQSQGETIELLVLLCSSASNVRFKMIESIVSSWTRVKRRGPDEKFRSFLALRERLVKLEGLCDYYRSRIGDLSRMGGRTRIAFIAEKTAKASMNIVPALASVVRNEKLRAKAPEPASRVEAVDDRRRSIGDAYATALRGYVVKPYRGRVTVLWPGEMPLDEPADPTAGWGRVASEVDLHTVPGGHITCITSNVSKLAETLSACLDGTRNRRSPEI